MARLNSIHILPFTKTLLDVEPVTFRWGSTYIGTACNQAKPVGDFGVCFVDGKEMEAVCRQTGKGCDNIVPYRYF